LNKRSIIRNSVYPYASAPLFNHLHANATVKKKRGGAIAMDKTSQTKEIQKKCDLCEQVMNPTILIYKDQTCLCKACYDHMLRMPEPLAKSVERFLIGNVV
jgi:hypothetical protein